MPRPKEKPPTEGGSARVRLDAYLQDNEGVDPTKLAIEFLLNEIDRLEDVVSKG